MKYVIRYLAIKLWLCLVYYSYSRIFSEFVKTSFYSFIVSLGISLNAMKKLDVYHLELDLDALIEIDIVLIDLEKYDGLCNNYCSILHNIILKYDIMFFMWGVIGSAKLDMALLKLIHMKGTSSSSILIIVSLLKRYISYVLKIGVCDAYPENVIIKFRLILKHIIFFESRFLRLSNCL